LSVGFMTLMFLPSLAAVQWGRYEYFQNLKLCETNAVTFCKGMKSVMLHNLPPCFSSTLYDFSSCRCAMSMLKYKFISEQPGTTVHSGTVPLTNTLNMLSYLEREQI